MEFGIHNDNGISRKDAGKDRARDKEAKEQMDRMLKIQEANAEQMARQNERID